MPLAVKSQAKKKLLKIQEELKAKNQSDVLESLCDYYFKHKELFISFWKAWKTGVEPC